MDILGRLEIIAETTSADWPTASIDWDYREAAKEIKRLRQHIADIGEAMRTKANNNPDGVKASTLEMLGDELLAALPSNALAQGREPHSGEASPGAMGSAAIDRR